MELLSSYEVGSVEIILFGCLLLAGVYKLAREAVSIFKKQKELKSAYIK